jgi:hypothetical protein
MRTPRPRCIHNGPPEMKLRFAAVSVLAATLAAGTPVLAQPVAAPAILSLALASPIALAPAVYSGVWLPAAAPPVYAGPRVVVHDDRVASARADRFMSASVQFDHGAAGLGNKVSTFGYAHAF